MPAFKVLFSEILPSKMVLSVFSVVVVPPSISILRHPLLILTIAMIAESANSFFMLFCLFDLFNVIRKRKIEIGSIFPVDGDCIFTGFGKVCIIVQVVVEISSLINNVRYIQLY